MTVLRVDPTLPRAESIDNCCHAGGKTHSRTRGGGPESVPASSASTRESSYRSPGRPRWKLARTPSAQELATFRFFASRVKASELRAEAQARRQEAERMRSSRDVKPRLASLTNREADMPELL